MINLFKDFNSSYQNLINIQKINFQTTYLFQMIFFIYSNKVEINSNLKNFCIKIMQIKNKLILTDWKMYF